MENKKRWYRKWNLDIPAEEVERVAAKATPPEEYTVSRLAGPYTPPNSEDLIGKTLTFRGEDRVFRFIFDGPHALRFSEADGEDKACYCDVKTLDHELYLVNQLIPGYPRTRQVTLVADLRSGCATVCDAHIGTPYSNTDVGREFIFGRLDGEFAGGELHHFTSELIGKAFSWDYGPGRMCVKHMYTSNLYYTYSMSTEDGAWIASNPADYVKLRDGVFLFSFVEERQPGTQGLFVIDVNNSHDMGCFYGYNPERIVSACIGALGIPGGVTTEF